MTVLVDTSVLLAYSFTHDKNHEAASKAMKDIVRTPRYVAAPVLTELFFMMVIRVNYNRAIKVFESTRSAFKIASLTESDMVRMQTIMEQYIDARFDFADTAIMAIAECMNITKVYTFDRRDFSIFRPSHCDYLELLP